MTERPYQICTRCVMDTSDPEITFDAEGVCSHCRRFERVIKPLWLPNDEGRRRLEAQAPVAERLARLEAQAEATRQSLVRIEAKLERAHDR